MVKESSLISHNKEEGKTEWVRGLREDGFNTFNNFLFLEKCLMLKCI